MSIKNKLQNFFYLDDEEEETVATPPPTRQRQEPRTVREQPKQVKPRNQSFGEPVQPATVVSLKSAQKSSKVVLVEPRVYAEAQDISEQLKNKKAVVVNLQRIDREQGIRIVDFLSGTVYAIGGDIQRIGTDIFLCVPENIEVDGAISDFFEQ
ncbi:cell division protein SepF [Sporosarcina sp. G11-34]|uniref:cell division protein SepF n=1 Tax=Sporosarcina sp. G11-34 TaxID=2849605 RepID=UPI0022A9D08A|nr:cell division protein SepF [Sporosarcina sp. G11-34]MCZ2258859.1 cell division protein SepF [Sporosarcina sp. G11-34]